MLRAAGLGCEVMAVTMTGGGREHGGSVPKRDLLAGVSVLLEKGQLRIGRVREAARLGRELVAMRMGKDGGEHDDLVIALALACWRARGRRVNGEGTRRIGSVNRFV
jgi:LmbE family N-acetylglucosaminyl deacetylase